MTLSQKQLQDVCMLHGQSDACRYLGEDDNDASKHYCLKKRQSDKSRIDKRVNQYIADCKSKGVDPYAQNIPLGDNCKGYPVLKVINQGYDCDN